MKRDRYWGAPKNAPCSEGKAWWYANKGHIDIHVQVPGAPHAVVKLPRKVLAEYIKRTAR